MTAPNADVLNGRSLLCKTANRSGYLPVEGRSAYNAVVLALSTAILISAMVFEAGNDGLYLCGIRLPMRCWLYETFGIKCALCGLSRSLCHFAHGNFRESLRFHTFGPAIFVFVCLQIPYRILMLRRGSTKTGMVLSYVNFAAVIVFAIGIFVNWLSYIGGLIL